MESKRSPKAQASASAAVVGLRPGGRPSLMTQRRTEVVQAFIALVGERGLEAVTVDDVAVAAGMQRSAVRHFVGNRRALIDAAVAELTERYVDSVRRGLTEVTGVEEMIDIVFSDRWRAEMSDNDRAFDILAREAADEQGADSALRGAYDAFLDEARRAVRKSYPHAPARRVREVSYALFCLSQESVYMQRLGYSSELSRAARRFALLIAATLNDGG